MALNGLVGVNTRGGQLVEGSMLLQVVGLRKYLELQPVQQQLYSKYRIERQKQERY